jgi:hypothetical protein
MPVPSVISPELQAVLRREASPCGAVPAADTTGGRPVTQGAWSAIVPADYRRIDTVRFQHGGARWGYGSRWFGAERGMWMNRRPGTTTDMVPCRATFAGREYLVQGGRNAAGGYDILAVPADATEMTTAMMGHADDLDGWYALWAMLAMAMR